MKIALISKMDNGQQMQLLAEALRKYTEHDALHLNQCMSFLEYDADLWIGNYNSDEGTLELRDKLQDYDDFFIFADQTPRICHNDMKKLLIELGIDQKLTKNNLIIRTAGSIARKNCKEFRYDQLTKGWIYTGGYHEFSIGPQVGFVAPTRNICPIDKIPEAMRDKDKLRICFSSTRARKGLFELNRVMERLKKEYDNVESVIIQGKTWKETMQLKSRCDITLAQLNRPPKLSAPIEKVYSILSYANTAIEGMWLQQAVLSRIDLWTQMLFPDLPIINVKNEDELYASLKELIEDPSLIEEVGKKGKAFIEKYHHPKVVAEQWDKLMRFVKEEYIG